MRGIRRHDLPRALITFQDQQLEKQRPVKHHRNAAHPFVGADHDLSPRCAIRLDQAADDGLVDERLIGQHDHRGPGIVGHCFDAGADGSTHALGKIGVVHGTGGCTL
ncbi:MAG: hypothetical protein AUI83_21845 [Armatimonadetes bacterium 13_1_40CM_3_65_7]|nr:MAG: hypothetical protein AUI83_21845 [Armatimonadetes bacterium 13_1_40CM_3_65_7]